MRVLNVAEKPSVAKAISSILGGRFVSKRDGLSPYNHIWEFPYQLNNTKCDMVFTSVTGHLMELEFDRAVKNWQGTPPIRLFDAPIHKSVGKDKQALKHTLEREARSCQWLVLWLDCDREGENICFEVMDVCLAVKPSLKVFRAHFSALIPRDIHNACTSLTEPNRLFSDAVDCRQEIDLRIGAAFTRFQTLRLQRLFPDLSSVISYGPCQFPTLGFVVERFLKRQRFVEEIFWRIDCNYRIDDCIAHFEWSRHRLFDHRPCVIIYEICLEHPQATVVNVNSRQTRKWRPKPLATVEFQKRAARYLRISSHRAMEVAEALYNRGFMSYPRTETDRFKEGTDLTTLISNQTQDPTWGAYAQNLLNGAFKHPTPGQNDDNAHPPIHPTKAASAELAGDELRVFQLVTRHFLACCSEDALGEQTTVTVALADEEFVARGLMITARNYLDVYPYERWSDRNIPLFRQGQTFVPTTIEMHESKTVPPPLLKEADLIALMDEHGIGTDATIAQHLMTIQERQYAVVSNLVYTPTDLGIALVQGYDAMGLAMSKPTLRAHMEAEMQKITRGERTKAEVLASCLSDMKAVFIEAVSMASQLEKHVAEYFPMIGQLGADVRTTVSALSQCGLCGSHMDLRETTGREKVVRFLFCPTCSMAHSIPPFGDISAYNHSCPICDFQVISLYNSEKGRSHTVCPYCFSNPPAHNRAVELRDGANSDQAQQQSTDIEDLRASGGGGSMQGMRCFNCTFSSCPLATGREDLPVRGCPECLSKGVQAVMFIRSSVKTAGNDNNSVPLKSYFLGCSNWPSCPGRIGFGSAVREVSHSGVLCEACTQRTGVRCYLLDFQFKPGQVPPTVELQQRGCVAGCDEELGEILGLNRIGRSNNNASTFRPAGGGGRSSSSNNPLRYQNQNNNHNIDAGAGGRRPPWRPSSYPTGNARPPLPFNGRPPPGAGSFFNQARPSQGQIRPFTTSHQFRPNNGAPARPGNGAAPSGRVSQFLNQFKGKVPMGDTPTGKSTRKKSTTGATPSSRSKKPRPDNAGNPAPKRSRKK